METRFVFKDFIKVFGLSIVLYGSFTALFATIPSVALSLQGVHPSVFFLIQYAIQFVILFFPLWLFVIHHYQAGPLDFGFKKVPFKKFIAVILGSYLTYFIFSAILAWFISSTQTSIPGYEAQASYLPIFGTDFLGLSTAFFFIVLVAPFLEELVFRGFIYRTFTKTWPVWMGSMLTAALFALIHFQFSSFIPLFILGLVLNFTYQVTKSIWTSIGFHLLNNAIAFGVEIYLFNNPEAWEQLEAVRVFIYNGVNLF